jgi:hypothetical protein
MGAHIEGRQGKEINYVVYRENQKGEVPYQTLRMFRAVL